MTILKLLCFLTLTLTAVLTLPIDRTVQDEVRVEVLSGVGAETLDEEKHIDNNAVQENFTLERNIVLRNNIRPGMEVTRYEVEITPNINARTFEGTLRAQISITDPDSRGDDMKLQVSDLDINSVSFAFVGGTQFSPADFSMNDDDGTVDIKTGFEATTYNFIIEYSGKLETVGQGLYVGSYGNNENYLAMNLYATNARRVFPCLDIPTEPSLISFSFENIDYNQVVMNSAPEENEPTSFAPIRGPPHLWTMVAHSLNNINLPRSNVLLFIRPGTNGQEMHGSSAIQYALNNLEEWTGLEYFDIMPGQNSQMQVVALPDISRNWHGLSSVVLWEPHVLMENSCSVKQRFTAFTKIAEALARQWYGYLIYPENYRFQWVVSGLASYAAFDLLREFQTVPAGAAEDIEMLDINTLFVTEVIQESLLRDSYIAATVMEPNDNIFDEDVVREHLNGILKYKAPAILRMLRLVLGGPDNDFVKAAGRALIAGRGFQQPQAVNMLNFVYALYSDYVHNGNGAIEDIEEYLEPFVTTNGYPLLTVQWRQGGVSITLERFNYFQTTTSNYNIPITYAVSNAPNYEESRIYPERMLSGTDSIDVMLDDDDYVLFNIQGQGYYRVSYDGILWERIIEALRDPERRVDIHPLNRATLLDDALNLARGGRLDYETAFHVALTWEHETEYAPWKAFVRNMDFLRKRLVAMVTEDEDLDPDIYLRMLRRSIAAFENEISFSPELPLNELAMTSLTRGLVMDHACRANYQPCIAAALDWFYDGDVVNPDIPKDMRPAVYCTAVREGGMDVIEALLERMEIEQSMWERVVILESLACSTNADYINGLLMETISPSVSYTTEERNKIFVAIAESSYENARRALDFLDLRSNEVREWYGGDERLEEMVNVLAENMVNSNAEPFSNFVISSLNQLGNAQLSADRARLIALENMSWENGRMQEVYEWIDENDAPSLMVSFTLMIVSCVLTLFNN